MWVLHVTKKPPEVCTLSSYAERSMKGKFGMCECLLSTTFCVKVQDAIGTFPANIKPFRALLIPLANVHWQVLKQTSHEGFMSALISGFGGEGRVFLVF